MLGFLLVVKLQAALRLRVANSLALTSPVM